MDDLTIVKRCAEAMGYTVESFGGSDRPFRLRDKDGDCVMGIGSGWIMSKYNPLHDDAQAMALVRKFGLAIAKTVPTGEWTASAFPGPYPTCTQGISSDLNRAICECIANLKSESG
jgi:hypothetical protein